MTRAGSSPPRIARRLLRWTLPRGEAAEWLDDLDELFAMRCERRSVGAARRWYWRQSVGFPLRVWCARSRPEAPARTRRPNAGSIGRDVTHAVRSFRRMPGFTALAVLTLAIGVGANAAMWSVAYPLVLSPLGYSDEDRIVRVWPEHHFTRERFELYRDSVRSSSVFSAYLSTRFTLTGDGQPELVSGLVVSPGHFAAFGVEPYLGRSFEPDDSLPGAEPVAMVSHRAWLERFGGSPDVLGRRLDLGGTEGARRTVVGVAPPGFRPLGVAHEIWVPMTFDPESESYSHMANLGIIARLGPGVSREQARAELAAIATASTPPPYYLDEVPTYSVQPFRDVLVKRSKPTFLALLGAAFVVLILSCANVASLLLVRNGSREKEIAIRRSLGASTTRLVRQLATENLVLGLAGSAAGIVGFVLAAPAVRSFVPPTMPRAADLGRGLDFALICAVLTLGSALLFGLLPLARIRDGAASGGRGLTPGPSRSRWNAVLVSVEVALALALVVSSGLLVKSLVRLQRVDAGFHPGHVVSMHVSPSSLRYRDDPSRVLYYREVLEAVRALPSVTSAGAIQILPLTSSFMGVGYSPSGATPVPTGTSPPVASYRVVSPGYRRTLGIPLLRGRDLSETDRASAPSVGLVNETLARRLFPHEDPIGRSVHFEDGSEWFRIVGVTGDVHHRLESAPEPEVYVPFLQDGWPSSMYLVARARTGPASLGASLREAVWSVDDDVPISEVRLMDDVVYGSLSVYRLRTGVFSLFSMLAFVLSAVGIYGVVSSAVAQRTREIGVRMALGASRGTVLFATLRHGSKPVLSGLVMGTGVALLASESLTTFFYSVEPTDPLVYAAAALALTATAALAGLVPARRASRVDPVSTLNAES